MGKYLFILCLFLFNPFSSEAKSLIYNLDNNSEPVMYNGEIEDSNSNYFVLRLADHAQFFAFNNKTDKVNLFFGVSRLIRSFDLFSGL